MVMEIKQGLLLCYRPCNIVTDLIRHTSNEIVNVGFDEEITIHDLAMVIHQIMDKEFKVEYKQVV